MTEAAGELRDIVRQLRTELEWAARTGVVVDNRPAPAPAEVEAAAPQPPAQQHQAPLRDQRPPQQPEAPPFRAQPPPRDQRPAQQQQAPRQQHQAPPFRDQAPSHDSRPAQQQQAPRQQHQSQAASGPKSLEIVRADLGDCTRCKLHQQGRRQIVFGVGNPNADLMFVGEGPGADEDRQGEPFVGKAGQLLTRIIGGMGLTREEVYIANIVKCRPPGNRDPEPDEIEQCLPFLEAQIASVRPKVLVALGRPATQTLMRRGVAITRIRGQWQTFADIPMMPTFHPAYVLRNVEAKRPVWEDMKAVLARLGRPVPQRG